MPNAKQRARANRIFADGRQIDRALKSAVKEAIRDHEERNAPVVVWRNGRAALVPVGELTRSAISGKHTISAKRTISPKRKAAKKRRAR